MSMPWFLGVIDFPTMEEITAAIGDWLALMFFWLIKAVFNIMDIFMDIIFQLAGLKNMGGTGGNILSSFFSSTGTKGDNSIATLYFSVCLVCIVLMFFLAIIAIIKQDFFSEEPAKSHAPIFKRLVTGVLYFMAIPPIFIFAVEIVAGLMSALMQIDSFAAVSSLSQTIFELSLTEPEWMSLSDIPLDPIPHWSVVDAKDFVALTKTYDFNWLIFIGIIGISFYSLFMIAFGLAKRVFNLILLYVLGPIAISQSVLDGGGKMKNWKDSVIKEFVSVFGTIIGLVIFFMFVTEVVSDLELFSIEGKTGFGKTAALLGNTVIKAMFILVGFSVIKGGGNGYIANAVGGNLSIDDGKNAFNGMKDSGKFAMTPFKSTAKFASGAVQKGVGFAKGVGKAYNTIADRDSREAFLNKHRPTLDGFRTDIQNEKIKAQRKTNDDAVKAVRAAQEKYNLDPSAANLRELQKAQRIANPGQMQTHIDGLVNPTTGTYVTTANGNRTNNITEANNLNNTGAGTYYSPVDGGTHSVRHADMNNVVTNVNALPDASANYNANDYTTVKRSIAVAIEAETQLMNVDVEAAEAELQRLVNNGANEALINDQKEVIHNIKTVHQEQLEHLTTIQEGVEKQETQHKAIHDIRQAGQGFDNVVTNSEHMSTSERNSVRINAGTKVEEKLKTAGEAFR